ncbi:Retrovirus-related Pol polyprotein from transposon TNT 1-94 [Abeliophyllum distichum]|uniref:Retrovirus-related Pol polyprotein from transposon TNT 1-94 n=1 Tax=Abeliophyllum distichum TaxID=126358 RepID=A0ABD1VZC3_9LAMI
MTFCETCVLGKPYRLSFGKEAHNSQRPLVYVHIDLWGPGKHSTHGGSHHLVLLTSSVGPQQNDVEETAFESPQQQQPDLDESKNPYLGEAHVDLQNYQLATYRERGEIRLNSKYSSLNLIEYALASRKAIEKFEPLTYKEAIKCPKSKSWIESMKEEIDSLIKDETWKLVS